ncbi:MAG TPA: hypothetical protein DD990_07495 [Cyanobacteria bacterium UBA11368]|nr:hypothetical protein [Cyanobacteria bacterium UBA11368]
MIKLASEKPAIVVSTPQEQQTQLSLQISVSDSVPEAERLPDRSQKLMAQWVLDENLKLYCQWVKVK